jgi:hypothetical protein
MRRIASLLLALAAAACASGRDFARPAADVLPLGLVTRADIVATYGRPDRQLVRVVSAPAEGSGASAPDTPAMGALTSLFYAYEDRGGAFGSGARQQKLLKFDFANDRLFAYSFLSNVRRDSSDFDEAKMARLANGVTTKDEVRALFGDPSGRAMFPALLPGDERYVYQFVDTANGEKLVKRLELVFGDDDVLREFSFVSDLGPAPRARGGASAPPLFGRREE